MVMAETIPPIVMSEETDPEEIRKARAQRDRQERNWSWLEAHVTEVYSHRGKVICVAGQELFVGDTSEEVLARAQTAHPEDNGWVTLYIPKERGARIYAHRWLVAARRG
jgi:hypothetical protein